MLQGSSMSFSYRVSWLNGFKTQEYHNSYAYADAGKGRLLVLGCFGHMVNFKLWHDLRFLRFLRSSKKLLYDPGQTPRVNEGPTMKRDPVIIICVDASSEPPAVCPRHWWSPTRHPATNQIMTVMTMIFPTYDSREQCLHSKTPESNKAWPLNLFRTLHIIFDMIRATYPSIVVATCLNHRVCL